MDRLARKTIHSLAHAYNLSSKSAGSGKTRFTTIFKTQTTQTAPLIESRINAILRRATGTSGRENRTKNSGPGGISGGANKHKDGHIVGGDAKEIGMDNKGRIMLEKLGWKSGMGLGAEGMGMKVPLVAVVKTGKGGLQ
jgi:G-patch domain/R3H domain